MNLEKGHYKEIEALTEKENGPVLVRNIQTKEFFVRKKYALTLQNRLEKLSLITHPHLPKIEEIVASNNELWLYEEFIHGKNLQEYIQLNQQLPTETTLEIAKSVTEALVVLHEKNLIHRDIKLTNIMISNDGVIKLIDFDAIRFYDGTKDTDTVNLGTLGFASPEQFGFAETDERSDIYSLGVVLNVCLTKNYPKDQLTTNVYLKDIVQKSIKLDPSNRFQSAKDMQAAIHQQLTLLKLEKNRPQPKQKISLEKKQSVSKPPIKKKVAQNQLNLITRYVPGFRTNQLWKKITASFGYLCILFGYSVMLSTGTTLDRFLEGITFTVIFILPFIILTNFLSIKKWIPFIHSNKLWAVCCGWLLVGICWFVLSGITIQTFENLYSPEFIEQRELNSTDSKT